MTVIVGEHFAISRQCDIRDVEDFIFVVYSSVKYDRNDFQFMIALRDDAGKLIGYYEKHEYRNRETAERYDFSE